MPTTTVRHSARADAPAFWYGPSLNVITLTSADTDGAFSTVEIELPTGFMAPLHSHRVEDETFVVLHGELTVFHDDTATVAGAGDTVFLPRGSVHGFRNDGPSVVHALSVFTPGGFEEFFVDLGQSVQEHPGQPAEGPSIEQIMAVSEKFQLEFVGPLPDPR